MVLSIVPAHFHSNIIYLFGMESNIQQDKFVPTVEWMEKNYTKLNAELFHGELGGCNFAIFTTGKGSQGNVLGWFKITRSGVKVRRYNRRMFYRNMYGFDETDIDRNNFVELCQPQIELNGNYSGTEEAWLHTLVHEMIHYYTYMYGYAPKQGHGPEFREACYLIYERSHGRFDTKRVASAEQMSEMELSADMKAKRERRMENKKSNVTLIMAFNSNNTFDLSNVSNQGLVDKIINANQTYKHPVKLVTSNDPRLVDLFFSRGYRRVFRTYRYWTIDTSKFGGNDFLEKGGYDINVIFDKTNGNDNNTIEKKPVERKNKMVFSIRTKSGIVEIPVDGNINNLKAKLRNRFPNMNDEALDRIVNNNANYRLVENHVNRGLVRMIVEDVMNQYGYNKNNDVIDISPDMNLGLESPFEAEMDKA